MKAAALVAALVAAAPGLALGDAGDGSGVPAKARSLAERGRAFHDAGDYANAITAFTQAYVMAPSPALLFNLAQAYRLQGNCDDAALMYRRFLAANPAPEQRALAESHLATVERCMHKLALHIPVETAARRAIAAPLAEPLAMRAVAPPPSRAAQIEKGVGLGLAISGGVSLAVAGYYAVQAHQAESDVADLYMRGGKWKDIAAIDERGQSAATAARWFGAGGAVGVVGGVVTYLIGKRDEAAPITVSPTSNGFKVGLRWNY
jgi:tetratricopeptide (TPR) repeat protein